MRSILALVLLLGCAMLNARGADALNIPALIREADEVVFYSLDPLPIYSTDLQGNPTAEEKKKERFHEYLVLGKIVQPGKKALATIRTAFLDALNSVPEGIYTPALCFDPRHALRLTLKGRQVDLLVCFECRTGYAFYSDAGVPKQEMFAVGPAGRPALNALLDARKIPRDIPQTQKHDKAAETKNPNGHSSP